MLHRGRIATRKLEILGIKDLSREDLSCVRAKRTEPAIARLRDPHHRLARLIASGLKVNEAAIEAGFSLARAYVLHADPSFQNLVESYRKDIREAFVSGQEDYYNEVTALNRKALRHIHEHFDKAEEEGDLVPLRMAHSVFTDTSDRVGIPKKSTSINVNLDFAAKLEERLKRARERSAEVQSPVIEGNLVRRI